MAAPSDPLLPFFTHIADMNGVIVREPPKFDLELYIQNYTGRTRFDRLLFIGKSSVPLCVEALKAAVTEAKAGSDVSRYLEAWDCIRLAAPQEPEAEKDNEWIQTTERSIKVNTLRLDTELKGYRNNLIKESIRMGNEDLGKHFENCGLLNEASEAYSRMRQDVSTSRHLIDCGMRLVSVALQRRDWNMVLSHLGKIVGVQGEDDKTGKAWTKIVSGVALFNLGHYQDAANHFLQIDCTVPMKEYNHVVTANDIANYGGLLALATMERSELQSRVLENQSFRSFLEEEPHVRKAISLFVNGKYSACLAMLDSMKTDFLLDIYLQQHIPDIYSRIRTKCIVQYCMPFSCCTIHSLEEAFGKPGEPIENELALMIQGGSLKARIDAKNKLLIATQENARQQMQKHALGIALFYEQEAKERLRRMNIIAAGLEVTGTKKPHTWGQPITEAWFDDSQVIIDPEA